jgi:AraC-like DNA-binding protein
VRATLEHIGATPQTSWRLHVRAEPRFEFCWHRHPEYELTLITAGSGQRFVGDSVELYQPGDLTLIGPDLPHTFVSSDHSPAQEAVVVQFRRDFLGADFFERPDFADLAALLDDADRGLAAHADLAEAPAAALRELSALPPTARTITLLRSLLTLVSTPGLRPLASEHYRARPRAVAQRRLDTVCEYLSTAYAEPLSLADVAVVAHMSPAAFSRFFRRAMGRTLTTYLNEVRVAAACRLLIDTDRPITEIAGDAGFGNISNFNRRFRLICGQSPREYRAAFNAEPGS